MITNGANGDGANGGAAAAYVNRVIDSWRSTGRPSAKRALEERGNLTIPDCLVLDLVYEEYCLRQHQGENPDASTFCDQFPTLRESIKDMLDVHDTIGTDSQIANSLIPAPVVWPETGDTYRGYHIQRSLGKGALARVYLASHNELGDRHVALKVSRDTKEAATTGRLDHPHIMDVNWVEYDESRNATWMCMPYCGAATLRDVIAQLHGDRLAPKQASEILDVASSKGSNATEVREPHAALEDGVYVEGCLHIGACLADALTHAHERGILHRDLKPTNVLLTASGAPKLLDFNLSSDPNVEVNRSGGTLGYMAPEHINSVFGFASGDAHVDARSEVYALGVILYELMTGQLPFGKPDLDDGPWVAAEEMLQSQARDEFPRPSLLNADIPEDVETLLLRCLNVDPNQRFQTVRELNQALIECRDRRSNEEQAIQRRKRNNLMTACGMLVGLLMFGIVQARQDAATWTVANGRRDFYERAAVNDWEGAEKAFETVPVEFHNATDTEMLAYAQAHSGQKIKAAMHYKRLFDRHPKEFRYANNLGYCLAKSQPEHAYLALRRAIRLRPDSVMALRNIIKVDVMLLRQEPDDYSTLSHAKLHVQRATAQDSDTKWIYEHGAHIMSLACDDDAIPDDWKDRKQLRPNAALAFKYAVRAVELGANPAAFHPDLYRVIGKDREAKLRATKRGKVFESIDDYLAKPDKTPHDLLNTL